MRPDEAQALNEKTPGMLRGLSFRSDKINVGQKHSGRIYLAAASSVLAGAAMVSLMTWMK